MSKEHEALKEVAIKILTDMGYTSSEIKEEYWVQPERNYSSKNNSLHGFRVDVVGLKANKKIAIECGKTPGEKIAALKMFFDEVIVLPYFSLNVDKLDLEHVIREKNEIIQNRDNEILELKKEISDRHFFISSIEEVTRAWMEIFYRLGSSHTTFFYYDFANKPDSEIITALTVKLNEIKEKVKQKEEQEQIRRELMNTSIVPTVST